jgi:hypothetical protein
MPFVFQTQPLCRFCGKPIAKHTERFRFGPHHRMIGDDARRDVKPVSKAEAQRHINGQIVSVEWSMQRDYIQSVTAWDGESYVDPFFCNGDHARRFAYAVARMEKPFITMSAYDSALKARSQR